ncbi:MAG: hypothetical protein AAGH76_01625 [Pseudomonadota bacterium]
MQIKSPIAGGAGPIATEGIRRGRAALTQAASDVANGDAGKDSKQFTQGLVDGRRAAQQIEASAKALERVSQSLGSLIDTLA